MITKRPLPVLQFSLRTLLIVMVLISSLLGLVLAPIIHLRQSIARQKAAAARFRELGTIVLGNKPHSRRTGMGWVIGDDTFADVTTIQVGQNARLADGELDLLQEFPELTTLWLMNDHMTDASLDRLENLPQLEELRLGSPHITDAGLDHLKRLKNLRSLQLFDTHVSSAGVAELRAALPGARITREITAQ
jgi:hypothetical protein